MKKILSVIVFIIMVKLIFAEAFVCQPAYGGGWTCFGSNGSCGSTFSTCSCNPSTCEGGQGSSAGCNSCCCNGTIAMPAPSDPEVILIMEGNYLVVTYDNQGHNIGDIDEVLELEENEVFKFDYVEELDRYVFKIYDYQVINEQVETYGYINNLEEAYARTVNVQQ